MPSGGQPSDIGIAVPTHVFNPVDQAIVLLYKRSVVPRLYLANSAMSALQNYSTVLQ
jgi:hypothetical protein